MGLLIGASVITLCEVLDLFIYNTFVKLSGKKNHIKNPPEGPFDIRTRHPSIISAKNYTPSIIED